MVGYIWYAPGPCDQQVLPIVGTVYSCCLFAFGERRGGCFGVLMLVFCFLQGSSSIILCGTLAPRIEHNRIIYNNQVQSSIGSNPRTGREV